MYIVKYSDQFDINHVYLCEPIKNNIMSNGSFIRIIYSNNHVSLNGINLLLTLDGVAVERFYTKYRCFFSTIQHKELIDKIKMIEEKVLKMISIYNKIPQFNVYDQLSSGYIKIFSNQSTNENMDTNLFMLKIAGIWETETNYGVTYKFSKIS